MRLLICTQAVDKKDPVLGFFHDWLTEFAKHSESVTVICLRKGEHALPAHVRILSLGKEKGTSRLGRIFLFYYYIVRHLLKYEAVFVHMNPEYVILGWPVWKLSGKRRVLWYTHKSVTFSLRLGSRMVDVICTASKESFRLKRKNVIVTGHGIDTKKFSLPRAWPIDFIRLVTVGRVSRSKELQVLLDAVSLLPKHDVPYRFSIVGAPVTHDDEKYQEELWDTLEDLKLSAFAGFTGPKTAEEVPAVLAASDIFIHASNTGSLDKAVLEAMAAECVVISSNDAAKPILNMVQDGLAVAKADPELFALAIQKVYAMGEDVRAKIGEQSRTLVLEKHSLTILIERLVNICKGNK